MNTILWVLQSLMALIFLIPGIFKLVYSEQQLVAKGMTGVAGLPLPLIRFIGIVEILGAIGIIFPMLLDICPVLTIISAFGFAVIMIPAAIINYNKHEYKKVAINAVILLICLYIAFARIHYIN